MSSSKLERVKDRLLKKFCGISLKRKKRRFLNTIKTKKNQILKPHCNRIHPKAMPIVLLLNPAALNYLFIYFFQCFLVHFVIVWNSLTHWQIDGLLEDHKIPVIVGGTNYYIESLLWKFLIVDVNQVRNECQTMA